MACGAWQRATILAALAAAVTVTAEANSQLKLSGRTQTEPGMPMRAPEACSGVCEVNGPCDSVKCNPSTGDCTGCGCSTVEGNGYWNYPKCDKECSADYHCFYTCNQTTGLCDTCDNYWANFPTCDVPCPSENHCDGTTGPCTDVGCNPNTPDGDCTDCGCSTVEGNGYWNYPKCDKECSADYHCFYTCNQTTGLCDTCDNYWANFPKCNVPCPATTHCDGNGPCTNVGCNPNTPDGDCTGCWCEDGYWPFPRCNQECSQACIDCSATDGTCSSCVPPWTGDWCQLDSDVVDKCGELLGDYVYRGLKTLQTATCNVIARAAFRVCAESVAAAIVGSDGALLLEVEALLATCTSIEVEVATECPKVGPSKIVSKASLSSVMERVCHHVLDDASWVLHKLDVPDRLSSTSVLADAAQPTIAPCFTACHSTLTRDNSSSTWHAVSLTSEVEWLSASRQRNVSYFDGSGSFVGSTAKSCGTNVTEPTGVTTVTMRNTTQLSLANRRCEVPADFLSFTVGNAWNGTLPASTFSLNYSQPVPPQGLVRQWVAHSGSLAPDVVYEEFVAVDSDGSTGTPLRLTFISDALQVMLNFTAFQPVNCTGTAL